MYAERVGTPYGAGQVWTAEQVAAAGCWSEGDRVFGGYLAVPEEMVGAGANMHVAAQAYGILATAKVSVIWDGVWDGDALSDLVTRLLGQPSSPRMLAAVRTAHLVDVRFEGYAHDLITRIEQQSGNKLLWDHYGNARWVTPRAERAPFAVSTDPDYVSSRPFWGWKRTPDWTQLRNGTVVLGNANRQPATEWFTGDGVTTVFTSAHAPHPLTGRGVRAAPGGQHGHVPVGAPDHHGRGARGAAGGGVGHAGHVGVRGGAGCACGRPLFRRRG